MMNNPFHKHLAILALLICAISPQLEAQYLNVPLIGQRNSQWCWAASMEMVMGYHGKTNISQCDLVKNLIVLQERRTNSGMPHNGIFPLNCCEDICTGSGTLTCNFSIDYSKRGGEVDYQYMDMLFSENQFFSFEDTNTDLMDWDAVEKEIRACRPFLIFLHKVDDDDDPYNHVVVAKGFDEILNGRYVLANDPIENPSRDTSCVGCEVLLPIRIFSDPPKRLNSALEVVRLIHPQNEDAPCDDCDPKKPTIDTSRLVSAVEDNSIKLTPLGNGIIGNSALNQLLNLTDGTGTPLFFAKSYSYWFVDWSQTPFVFGTVQYIGLVSNDTNPKLAFFLERADTSWVVKSISLAACTALTDTVGLLAANSSADTIIFGGNNLEIIEIMPGFYRFYSVRYKEINYLSPIKEYPDLPYKTPILYPEEKVKRELLQILSERRNITSTDGGERQDDSIDDLDSTKKKKGCFRWLFGKKKSK